MTMPNPDQPERCPSIDPHGSLQCGRSIHADDRCRFGGIAWVKGTPRYISAEERITRVLDLCDFWDKISKGETATTRQIREALSKDAS